MPKSQTVSDAILEELQAIRDSIEVIERRSKYLKPPAAIKKASQDILTGVLRGVGLFIGGTVVVGIIALFVRQAFTSGTVQEFFGRQIEQSVDNAIENRLPKLPFNGQ
jgi:hypothetical protein